MVQLLWKLFNVADTHPVTDNKVSDADCNHVGVLSAPEWASRVTPAAAVARTADTRTQFHLMSLPLRFPCKVGARLILELESDAACHTLVMPQTLLTLHLASAHCRDHRALGLPEYGGTAPHWLPTRLDAESILQLE